MNVEINDKFEKVRTKNSLGNLDICEAVGCADVQPSCREAWSTRAGAWGLLSQMELLRLKPQAKRLIQLMGRQLQNCLS